MTTLFDCVDTNTGKAGIIVRSEHAMDLMHKGYSHKEDICFYVHRDEDKDRKNKAAFSVSRFKKEHKTQLFNELKVLRSRGNNFLMLNREDKEGVMRHVIAVWKDGEEPDPSGVAISRVQPGSIYWFHSEKNRNIVHDWITKKPKEVPKSAEETKSCVLCDGEYEGEGNNSLPIMGGLCCDKCNTEKVMSARLGKYKSGNSAEEPKSDSDSSEKYISDKSTEEPKSAKNLSRFPSSSDSDSSYDSDEEKLLNDMGFSLWDTAKKPKRPLILTTKQMDMMYWIVDCSYTKKDITERVGEARYEKYYPLYVLLKKLKNSKKIYELAPEAQVHQVRRGAQEDHGPEAPRPHQEANWQGAMHHGRQATS